MKKLTLIFGLALLLVACTPAPEEETPVDEMPTVDETPVEEETPDQDDVDAPEDWVLLDQGDFTMYAPEGWKLTPMQGIDTQVGEVSGEGVTLSYDYGMFASLFTNDSTYDVADYDVEELEINGFDAVIYTPKETGKGWTVVNFESPRGDGHLNFYGENLTEEQEETVVDIFKTIFFKQ